MLEGLRSAGRVRAELRQCTETPWQSAGHEWRKPNTARGKARMNVENAKAETNNRSEETEEFEKENNSKGIKKMNKIC